MTRLVMLLIPLTFAVAGCEVGHLRLAPMTLAPSDAAPASCDTTPSGDCKSPSQAK